MQKIKKNGNAGTKGNLANEGTKKKRQVKEIYYKNERVRRMQERGWWKVEVKDDKERENSNNKRAGEEEDD